MGFRKLLDAEENEFQLIWIDDRFYFPEMGDTAEFKSDAESLMDERWVQAVMNETPDVFVSDSMNDFVEHGISFRKICESLKFGFGVTNFDYLNSNQEMLKNSGAYFLVDIRNDRVQNGEQQTLFDDWPKELYGTHFVKYWELPETRYRFFTRFGSINDDLQGVADIFGYSSPSECAYLFIPMNKSASEHVEKWLKSNYHSIPGIEQALRVYSHPWRNNWKTMGNNSHWSHSILEGEDGKHYADLLTNWLNRSVYFESVEGLNSAKSLCIWAHTASGPAEYPWEYQTDLFHNGRRINSEFLSAVLKSLRITNVSISGTGEYPMPICPALPFFLSLRCLQYELEKSGMYDKISIDEFRGGKGELCSISIFLNSPIKFSKPGYDVAKAFHNVLSENETEPGHYHGIGRALHNLLYCRINIDEKNDERWAKAFRGKGLKIPCVGVLFAPRVIRLIWTGRPGEE